MPSTGEGIDNDGDGFINEDGPGGVNINRNFMHEYPYYKPEAGRYMVSEAETKAVMAWLVKHRNVAAVLAFGENDNLITAPNAQGRYGAARTLDLTSFAEASIAGASKTGMFAAGGLAALFGRGGRGGGEMMISEDMLQALMASGGGYVHGRRRSARRHTCGHGGNGRRPGRSAFANAGRSRQPGRRGILPPRLRQVRGADRNPDGAPSGQARGRLLPNRILPLRRAVLLDTGLGPARSAPRGRPRDGRRRRGGAPGGGGGQPNAAQMQAFMAQRGGAAGGRAAGGAAGAGDAESAAIDKTLLQWMDREKIDGFVAWTAVKHPDLGDVEVGGFKPYAAVNPPPAKIAELGKSHAEFALYLTSLFPKMAVAKLDAVAQGGGLYRVKAEVENIGFWPTAMTHAVIARAVRPTMVQLQVAPESILSGNQKTNFVQSLTGSGGRQKFDWLIKGKAGDTLTLKVVSQKAGAAEAAVTLK